MKKHRAIVKLILPHHGTISTALLIFAILLPGLSFAQIPVSVTGGNNATPALQANYANFAAALTAVNNITSLSGPIVLNLAAGNSEFAPTNKGFVLGSSSLNSKLSSTNNITIQKEGVGSVILLAQAGNALASGAAPDGILSLQGADFITLDGLTFTDTNSASSTVAMEFALAFFKLSAGDGCQFNLVKNCQFNLQKVNNSVGGSIMPDGATAILLVNSVASSANASLSVTNGGTIATNGTHSNNKFYSNIITGGNNGFVLNGFAASVGTGTSPDASTFLGDLNNDIGGTPGLSSLGNSVLNFGGGGSNTAIGIRLNNQWGANISNNSINNNDGSGSNHAGTLRGIHTQAGIAANLIISDNNLSLKGNSLYVIDNAVGSSGTNNTVKISNNSISGCSYLSGLGAFFLISNTATAQNVSIENNLIQNISFPSIGPNGVPYFVYNAANVPGVLKMNGNFIRDVVNISSINNTHILYNSSSTRNIEIKDNFIDNIRKSNTSTSGANYIVYQTGSPSGGTLTFSGNVVNGISNGSSGGTITCFFSNSNNQALVASGNRLSNITLNNGTTACNGFYAFGLTSQSYYGNIIRNFNVSGSIAVHGIYSTGGGVKREIISNNISKISSANASYGIYSSGGIGSVYKNKIYDISTTSSGSAAQGMYFSGGTVLNIHNNLIGEIKAPNGNSNFAVYGIQIFSGSNYYLTHNTIYLSAVSTGTNFGTHALYAYNSSTNLLLRNNILINTSSPRGTSYATAFATSGAYNAAYYGSASNSNFFYAGVPSPKKLIYWGGNTVNLVSQLDSFKVLVSGRDSNSVTDTSFGYPSFEPLTFFESLNPEDSNFLKPFGCNSAVSNTAIFVDSIPVDFVSQNRNILRPDIGCWEIVDDSLNSIWTGNEDVDWNNPRNWCGSLPNANSDVSISAGRPNYPIITSLTSPAVAVRNLTISGGAGAELTIENGGQLRITGQCFHAGKITNYGTILLGGNVKQQFPGGKGEIAYMNILKVENSSGANIDHDLTISGRFEPGSSQITLDSAIITLRSTSDTTAAIGEIEELPGFYYSGKGSFVVERFIPSGRKWRLLSVPIINDTLSIRDSWQEGANSINENPRPGYGTIVTSPSQLWMANGFDTISPGGPSMKKFDQLTQSFIPVTNTLANLADDNGYYLFIRGDRTAKPGAVVNSSTTLRTQGRLYIGSKQVNFQGTGFASVGNPFASAIDFSKLGRVNIPNSFYVWDPKLGGTYNLGGFQACNNVGGEYLVSTMGGSYPDGTNKIIESGQAFLINALNNGASIIFPENSKNTESRNVFKSQPSQTVRMRISLDAMQDNQTAQLLDGCLICFDNGFSNECDSNDASKFFNSSENIAIRKGVKFLSIELRRPVEVNDTIQIFLTNLKARKYQLRINVGEWIQNGMAAFLEDQHSKIRNELWDIGDFVYPFEVDQNASSKANDRLRIIIRRPGKGPDKRRDGRSVT